jgi:Tol biopolymer transport system component
MAGAVAGAAVVGAAWVAPRPEPTSPPAMRFVQPAPAGTTLASGGILSPDGRHLAFVARNEGSGVAQLWVRALDGADPRPLPGTEDAARPFWSPDSTTLGYFADGRLKAVGLGGEPPRTIATVGARAGAASWGSQGVIVYGDRRSGLFSVPSAGGPISAVTTLDPSGSEAAHRWPSFLPDGRRFLYHVVSGNPDRAGVYVGAIDKSVNVRVLDASSAPAFFAPSGHVLFVREGVLMAQRFDAPRLRTTGPPESVAPNVPAPSLISGTVISAAAGGMLAFGGGGGTERLAWFDREGRHLADVDAPTTLHNVTLSPDGRMLLADSVDGDRRGIWVVDLERGAATRVHHDGVIPAWSPDAARVAFTSSRVAAGHIFVKPTAGDGRDEILVESEEATTVEDWSRDGRHLVFSRTSRDTRQDLWVLTIGAGPPQPWLRTSANEMYARVSTDGRWVAYMSDESGDWEVYVQAFPGGGHKRAVSVGGGSHPLWNASGRELYYLAADRTLMAVDITPGPEPSVGRPRALFRTRVTGDATAYRTPYAVSPDGRRFLIDSVEDTSPHAPITVMINWLERLNR